MNAELYQILGLVVAVIVGVLILRRSSTIRPPKSDLSEPNFPTSRDINLPSGPPEPPSALTTQRARIPRSQVERYVREHVVEIAEENFPDDIGLEWEIRGFTHKGALSFAEVEPSGFTGYERYQFVFLTAEEGDPILIGEYAFEAGAYYLLATAPGCPEDLPNRL